MAVKLALQKMSEWVEELGAVAGGAVEVTLESVLLKDFLDDLCQIGGVAGALFKLGARAIPDPTPEQRIAARLHRTFLVTLDRELKANPDLIAPETWRYYIKAKLPQVAAAKMAVNFTWLSVFGSRGRKPSRTWPLVGELADIGRAWVVEASAHDKGPSDELQHTADVLRGRLHEALTRAVDELVTEPEIKLAFEQATPGVGREALLLLAEELTTLTGYRLFGEVPQEAVYLEPTLKLVDLRQPNAKLDWSKVEPAKQGDRLLFEAIKGTSTADRPRLVVIVGDMGVGKSCMMRALAARLAEQFLADRAWAPIFARWRDVYDTPDLVKAIAQQLDAEYGLPLHDLSEQTELVYLIDGFDEMKSHQEGYLSECFNRLAALSQRRCTVVVAMRSTVITDGLKLSWKNNRAVVAQVQEFNDRDVDTWAEKWRHDSGQTDVTGKRLRSLRKPKPNQKDEVAHNPLLLYMLARHVLPAAGQRAGGLTRTEVFQIFVNRTTRGKFDLGSDH